MCENETLLCEIDDNEDRHMILIWQRFYNEIDSSVKLTGSRCAHREKKKKEEKKHAVKVKSDPLLEDFCRISIFSLAPTSEAINERGVNKPPAKLCPIFYLSPPTHPVSTNCRDCFTRETLGKNPKSFLTFTTLESIAHCFVIRWI
jgi:hypothetical protein